MPNHTHKGLPVQSDVRAGIGTWQDKYNEYVSQCEDSNNNSPLSLPTCMANAAFKTIVYQLQNNGEDI